MNIVETYKQTMSLRTSFVQIWPTKQTFLNFNFSCFCNYLLTNQFEIMYTFI